MSVPYSKSPQTFIRSLKAPSDPPEPNGPLKIEIAAHAWHDSAFYLQNKSQVIVEWIITRLLKDKAKNKDENLILDPRYWYLLAEIIESGHLSPRLPVKTWLLPILNRISTAPIFLTLLGLLPSLDVKSRLQIIPPVSRCVSLLWPLAAPRFTPDNLMDCFGMFLGVSLKAMDEYIYQIGSLIVNSFRMFLSNTPNKKRFYASFTQTYFQNWLACASRLDPLLSPSSPSSAFADLFSNLYSAGIDVLFNVDTLRQNANIFSGKFYEVLGSSSPLVLPVLPLLLASSIQCARKHRTALFGPGSNTTSDMRAMGMEFFASSCALLDRINDKEEQIWSTRCALLDTLQKEELYDTTKEGITIVLKQNGELAVTALRTLYSELPELTRITEITFALNVLTILLRIDYDLVSPLLSRVLPCLLLIQEHPETTTFLHLLLETHSRARTLPNYVGQLLTSFTSLPDFSLYVYHLASSSALAQFASSSALSRSIHGFVTPSQIMDIIDNILEDEHGLQSVWDQMWSGSTEDARLKKNRRDRANGNHSSTRTMAADTETLAIKFSLLVSLASNVFSSLPLQMLPMSQRKAALERVVEVRVTSSDAITFLLHKRKEMTNRWWIEVVAAAALRFRYAMRHSHGGHPPRHSEGEGEIGTDVGEVLELVEEGNAVLPELTLEIYRTLFGRCDAGASSSMNLVLDSFLTTIEREDASDVDISWSGASSRLETRNKCESLAVALLHLLTQRWLSLVDQSASETQLSRIINILTNAQVGGHRDSSDHERSRHTITPIVILRRTLGDAQFWELKNLRAALLTCITTETSVFSIPSEGGGKHIRRATQAYEWLLYAPMEYLPRTFRVEMTKRALASDFSLASVATPDGIGERCAILLRVFLKRVFAYLGTVEHPDVPGYAIHLVNAFYLPHTSEYTVASLDIIGMHFAALIRSSQESYRNASSQIIRSLVMGVDFDEATAKVASPPRLILIRVLDTITTVVSLSDVSNQNRVSLVELSKTLTTRLQPVLLELARRKLLDDLETYRELLAIWRYLLALQRWLGSVPCDPKRIGPILVTKALHLNSCEMSLVEDIFGETFAIVLEELQSIHNDDKPFHMEITIATYASLTSMLESTGQTKLDNYMVGACRSLSISAFSSALDLLFHGLSSKSHRTSELAALVHMSSLLIRESPEGTLKIVQFFTNKCLNLFCDQPNFYTGEPTLRHEILDFISKQCLDRPAMIRNTDVHSIWSLFSNLLAGSPHHEIKTSSTTFHQIVTTVSALVRLRRDLMASTLPLLGFILRQLFMSIRNVRAELARKQSKLVTDTLPVWINASTEPLSSGEGKVLARLLTALTTKSIPRTHLSHTEPQKAESLAKSFSKHAAYVLEAYIEAMNEPLCVLPSDMRRELQPGLFSLCEMVSEHNRDAMMVTALDASGKATFKALWKEYEKQRYVGKG